jgi:TFIIF-interacting CTD phosphatase-like protein
MDADDRGCPLLILDLDETLIHSVDDPFDYSPDFRVGPFNVYCRPGLSNFLEKVSRSYELAVWSSASEDYVEEIASRIWPKGFSFVWARTRCVTRLNPELYEQIYLKDLKKVRRCGYRLERVLIVDDSPEKVTRHYGNSIYIQPFEGDRSDQVLESLGGYLESIASTPNFRVLEKRGWAHRYHD